jgi:hypothetical protein
MGKNIIFLILFLLVSGCSRNQSLWYSNFGVNSESVEIVLKTSFADKYSMDYIKINESAKYFIRDAEDSKYIFVNNKFYDINEKNNKGRVIDFSKIGKELIQANDYDIDFYIHEWTCLEQKNLEQHKIAFEFDGKKMVVDKYSYNVKNEDWNKKGLISYMFCKSAIRMSDDLFGKYIRFQKEKMSKLKSSTQDEIFRSFEQQQKIFKDNITRVDIYALNGVPLKIDYYNNKKLFISQWIKEIKPYTLTDTEITSAMKNIDFEDTTQNYISVFKLGKR